MSHLITAACRHADGTISSPTSVGVRHVVSEDSDHFRTRLAVIHGFCDLGNLDHPLMREMNIELHETNTLSELDEVKLLRSSQRVFFEERDDYFDQIVSSSNTESIQVIFVVVMTAVSINLTDSKMALK